MKPTIAFLSLIQVLILVTFARADNYGAIAYDLKTNGYGLSWDQTSQEAANQNAMRKCATVSSNCEVVHKFVNNCGAYATGRNETWGTGYGATREVAETAAKFFCNRQGTGCKTRVWACNTTYGSAETLVDSGSGPKVDPDAAARNRAYAESARSWGGQEQYDKICSNSPGGCN